MNERIKQSILRCRKHIKAVLASNPMQSPYRENECLRNLDANIIAIFFMKQIRRGVVSSTGDNRG